MAPKIRTIGEPSPANEAIGGVPEITYYDFQSRGRGEVLRLFMEEAGISFVDIRYSFDEWNGKSEQERAEINPVGSLPFIKLGDEYLAQTYPLLRRWSAQLGKYDGKTVEEKYHVDVICDLALDWRSKFVDSAFQTDKNGLTAKDDQGPFKQHKQFMLPKFAKGIDAVLAKSQFGGPFSLGETFTYADCVVYQIAHDEREIGGGFNELDTPHLHRLVKAVEARPRIKEYFASDRYYN